MKRLIIPAAALFALLIGSSFLFTDMASEDVRNLEPFYGIGISVHADVFYTQGNNHEVRIEGNDRDVKDLKTEVKDGFLQVKYENYKMKRSKVTIYITSKELEKVKNSGSSQFRADKAVSSEEMEISMSGSGGITFTQLDSDEVKVKISGSGDVTFGKGKADELNTRISGSGKLLAEHFEVSECLVAISGSGSCKITVNDELDAKLSGSGKVYYHGDPQVNSVSSG
ncbi:MAG: DUF2807 domain-containing protein, partial [Bacteroidales bacterium]|nr:DUF2807 domain-containing protein [Bacteroidales bacterium]